LRIAFAVELLSANWDAGMPEAIATEAEVWPADLIVIGTRGRRGLSCLLLGSVAEGVVRVANKPVLLIREQ
jgi:nucleotide-binding universal stress UspA family protein